MDDSLIARVIWRYHPEWEAPENRKTWNQCLCPFHGDETPSAAVSYEKEAFNCLACGVKGDIVTLIKNIEEVSYAEAQRISEGISEGSDRAVPTKYARKSRRRVFGDEGTEVRQRPSGGRPVHARIRGRTTPWT